jgi:hypothetical protein
MSSPAQRSLKYLRDQGYIAQVVEKWNPYARVRVDLFGFIDIVALKDGEKGVFAIQTTSTSNMGARIKKIISIPEAKKWMVAGNKIFVQGWAKRGGVGKRKTWQVKQTVINLVDLLSEKI